MAAHHTHPLCTRESMTVLLELDREWERWGGRKGEERERWGEEREGCGEEREGCGEEREGCGEVKRLYMAFLYKPFF